MAKYETYAVRVWYKVPNNAQLNPPSGTWPVESTYVEIDVKAASPKHALQKAVREGVDLSDTDFGMFIPAHSVILSELAEDYDGD